MSTLRVAVVGGGRNCEHDVSLASAAGVGAALAESGHDVVALTIGRTGSWLDATEREIGLGAAVGVLQGCDVVAPVLHGPLGEDGVAAALCELAGVPYVGSPVGAGAVAMDKGLTKLVACEHGIAVASGRVVTSADTTDVPWSGPVVVKPVAAGSSHGVSFVDDPSRLAEALDAAFALDHQVLVEELVVGREVDVAVLGRPDGSLVIAPALEIVTDGVFDLATKYDGSADFRVPAALAEDDRAALEQAAATMYRALGCRGVARVDFFLTEDGPVLNEVNTMPGFTEQSQVPRMFAAAGTSYPALVDLLVRDAVAWPSA